MPETSLKSKPKYEFIRSILLPFKTGEGSGKFVLKSALFYTLGLIVLYLLFGKIMQNASVTYQQNLLSDPQHIGQAMMKMFAVSLPMYLGLWGLWVMVEAALLRRVAFGPDTRPFPWRFGMDEMRVAFSQFVVGFLSFILFFIVYFVFALIAMSIVAGTRNMAVMMVTLLFAVLLSMLVTSYFTIRLSPASARSVVQKRLGISEAWKVSKNRFWAAFGSYLLVGVIGTVIYIALTMMLMSILYGNEYFSLLKGAFSGDKSAGLKMTELMSDGKGAMLRSLVLMAVIGPFSTIWFMCLAGVPAYLSKLYEKAQGLTDAQVFD